MSRCRICLSEDNVVDLYDNGLKDSKELRRFLTVASGIQIDQNDRTSRSVCHKCCLIAMKLFKYRTEAMKIDKVLKQEAGQPYLDESNNMRMTFKTEPPESPPETPSETLDEPNIRMVNGEKSKSARNIRSKKQTPPKEKVQPQNTSNSFGLKIVNVMSLSDETDSNAPKPHKSVHKLMKKYPGLVVPPEIEACNVNPEVWLDNVDVKKHLEKENAHLMSKLEDIEHELVRQETMNRQMREVQVAEIKQEAPIVVSDDEVDEKPNVLRLGNILVKRVVASSSSVNEKLSKWLQESRSESPDVKPKVKKPFVGPLSVKRARLKAQGRGFSGPLSVKNRRKREEEERSLGRSYAKKARTFKRETSSSSDSSQSSDEEFRRKFKKRRLEIKRESTYLFRCSLCDEEFYEKAKLDAHRRKHPTCLLCNKRLLNRRDLSKHLQKSCPVDIKNTSPIVKLPKIETVKSVVERYNDAFVAPVIKIQEDDESDASDNEAPYYSDNEDVDDPLAIEHILLPKPSDNLMNESEEVLGVGNVDFWMDTNDEPSVEPTEDSGPSESRLQEFLKKAGPQTMVDLTASASQLVQKPHKESTKKKNENTKTHVPSVIRVNPNTQPHLMQKKQQNSAVSGRRTSDVVCISDDDDKAGPSQSSAPKKIYTRAVINKNTNSVIVNETIVSSGKPSAQCKNLPSVLKPSVQMIGAENISKENLSKDQVIKLLFETYEKKMVDTSKIQLGFTESTVVPTRVVETQNTIEFHNLPTLLQHTFVPLHVHYGGRLAVTYTSQLTGPAPHIIINQNARKWCFSIPKTGTTGTEGQATKNATKCIPKTGTTNTTLNPPPLPAPATPLPPPLLPAYVPPISNPPIVSKPTNQIIAPQPQTKVYATMLEELAQINSSISHVNASLPTAVPRQDVLSASVQPTQVGTPMMVMPQLIGQAGVPPSFQLVASGGNIFCVQTQMPLMQPVQRESTVTIEEIPTGDDALSTDVSSRNR